MNSIPSKTGLLTLALLFGSATYGLASDGYHLHESGYLEKRGVNVTLFADYYPEGHQGALTIIQNGERIAANGDIRLEPTPGQWDPIPKVINKGHDPDKGFLWATLAFPDESRDRKGFNPIIYPDLKFQYHIRVIPDGDSFMIHVDLDEPLPTEWIGKVGFILELFPGHFFERPFIMDEQTGIFPRQVNGPFVHSPDGKHTAEPLATGKRLSLTPERSGDLIVIDGKGSTLELIDGRSIHNNGWFIVRSAIPEGATRDAIVWEVNVSSEKDWTYQPVIHLSQVGYHPDQSKEVVIERDPNDKRAIEAITIEQIQPDGSRKVVKSGQPDAWGRFLRYDYLTFDFSDLREPGIYQASQGKTVSNVFRIDPLVYDRHVWQPTLEYFLPVQMCHVRVNDRYKVWHDFCHMDDARMAPVNHNHFDGYIQGPDTLTKWKSGEKVPGLNKGGWHDAGDYDLRVESQIGTCYALALAQEEFGVDFDTTTIDQNASIVEMHRPDGTPDILQQIEHGLLTVLGGYEALGRLYRGIIENDLRQYVFLGDGAGITDNRFYDSDLAPGEPGPTTSSIPDDRWVFTENNPAHELQTAAGLAACARVLKDYDEALANRSREVAIALFDAARIPDSASEQGGTQDGSPRALSARVVAAAELLLTTGDKRYAEAIIDNLPIIEAHFRYVGWAVGKARHLIQDEDFLNRLDQAALAYQTFVREQQAENPFRVPYRPNIWGDGWNIQRFGYQHYFLNKTWPDIFDLEPMFRALDFVLGHHPGQNTSSFVSGVGAKSVTVAYGVNRDEWSYIPGGAVSGTAIIRPDYPELKEWPYFWQQTEYVLGGGATHFMFLALAAHHVLNEAP